MKKVTYALVSGLMVFAAAAYASHSWSTYHWARTTSSFDLKVVNSITADWDDYVTRAIADWSGSVTSPTAKMLGSVSRAFL